MPIDRALTRAHPDDDLLLVLHDPDRAYTHSEICDLLDQAERLGFAFDGPELRTLRTVRELDRLVHLRQ